MSFNPEKFVQQEIENVKKQIGNAKAIVALSGGVDSFTAATLAGKAIGKNLFAVYVDTGLMRKNETEKVKIAAQKVGLNLKVIHAEDKFLSALKDVTDPEQKRKIIGELFIRIFEEESKKDKVTYLIQGTIAPDWIESGGAGRHNIKSHHNVGGLPQKMNLLLCEPLREIYKHEVRESAKALGLPDYIYNRQPFPGPALAVRIIGSITKEKVKLLQEAIDIVETEIESAAKNNQIQLPWQYFAALLDTKTVGVRGDERSYQYTLAVRAVDSLDGMTANFSHLPSELLQKISTRITNEVREIGRVVYDITNKPPATIELE
ncbi:MAG: glutamine-hydrolyzing GMP synthase [Candidatus Micrarchaeota archaeon]